MTPKALRFWPVLVSVLCPLTAFAQSAELDFQWKLEGAFGVALRPTPEQWHFWSYTIDVGGSLTPRVSWRVGVDVERYPSIPRGHRHSIHVQGVSFGFLATATAHDRGSYITGRFGLYGHIDGQHPTPGAYVGVGVAAPFGPGALTFETGLQGYAIRPPGPDDSRSSGNGVNFLAVPIRVGYRWLV